MTTPALLVAASLAGVLVAAVLLVHVQRRLSRRAAIREAIRRGRASMRRPVVRTFSMCAPCDLIQLSRRASCIRCGRPVAEVDPMVTRGEA